MVIKCPSDGCSWTGELRDKEVKTQSKNQIQEAVDNLIISMLSRPQSLSVTLILNESSILLMALRC